jgi:glutamate synthase (NADPH/NADH) small chain
VSSGTLPVPENLERFPELHPPFDPQAALVEANRCLYCFDAPCTGACPTHIDVPRFIKKISTGNLRGSALTILDANILGLSCARVCPVDVLCQGACVLDRYNQKPIEIGRLQRYAMDGFYAGGARLAVAPPHPGRVACIGAGPASIGCAAELRRQGCAVTVLDNRALPGGLNTYGVAEYKLRPSDSLREVELVRSLGVEFRQAAVGGDVSLDAVERDFDFVFIGVGLGAMERLGIPGEDLDGVIDALKFIERYKTSPNVAVGRRVIVVGGGNTAIDAANAARRLGADEVHILYRRGEEEMPAFDFEYEHSKVEGVRFHWRLQPVAILPAANDPSRTGGLRLVRMRLGMPDASGRRRPEPESGSEFDFPCDMVIPAIGQSRLMAGLAASRGIRLENGCIAVDRATGQTTNPKFYAGGDCVNGGREVVDAVADGKRAARAILARLGAD